MARGLSQARLQPISLPYARTHHTSMIKGVSDPAGARTVAVPRPDPKSIPPSGTMLSFPVRYDRMGN